ncbi:LD-carboxypeptidase [Bacillus sp. HMF5848]|uniref:S66 family peptidase n=1 Tax=Bacillus sp. HMF5848 TaxID=2495421 RepID=UPI000F78A7A3|nr:S66 peptidase family protein [Bacillus sp. HMF5848]RSK28237.1 LD-carboxypeptidase [Bacillus sp. HMF5848]
MITYPTLVKPATIGVTASSSGVPTELHDILKLACHRMNEKGFKTVCGETVWTQHKAKSASALVRADEFNTMMKDDNIHMIVPPLGGELLLEMIEYVDFENIREKWVLGYSDVSVLLLAITLKTGMATAHGPNLMELRGEFEDDTTRNWQSVLATKRGETVTQYASEKYQAKWQHHDSSSCVFHLTEPTHWRTVCSNNFHKIQGRLLGGCIDIIRHLIGTPYGDMKNFQQQFIKGDKVIWYLENCELRTTDLRVSLVQMTLAGWFDQCAGIMFGRSYANTAVEQYTVEDVYEELANELQIPIFYDLDFGHVPPQMTLINGAFAEVEVQGGKGSIVQRFV